MACEKTNVYMNIILLSKLGDALETERQQSMQSDRTNRKYMTEQYKLQFYSKSPKLRTAAVMTKKVRMS